MLTRASAGTPDKLYNLEIRQYESNGNYITGTGNDYGNVEIGKSLSVNLKERSDCQLVLVARGSGGAVSALGSNSLGKVQSMIIKSSVISAVDPSGSGGINEMPYVLHLEHVKVAVVGGIPVIQSKEGNYDVRLLLRRLATRLTVNWDVSGEFTTAGYKLKEVKLCQVPADYRLLPNKEETEWDITYPSTVVEFVDYYRLMDTELANANGTKTVWIPANVRGISANATSAYYRTKENAPVAASYVELVVDNSQKKERLYYRVYLGGKETTDFNLYENTDYEWTVHINSANYQLDGRIQLLDQTPVVSTNLVPTSNCLMMLPGTNICFNPYKHEAGEGGLNTYLSGKSIAKVQLLWQSKDNGTSGELVMGYAIDADNHQNLVNYENITDHDNARVYVKVPQTQGGNAVIAAYDGSGTIIWSWHLWITDYVPARINATAISSTETQKAELTKAVNATSGGSVHQYGGPAWAYSSGKFYGKVIMDRALGALRNTYSENNALESARAYGNIYQWGRKDPMPGSADGGRDDIGLMFDAVGKTIELRKLSNGSLELAIQHPDAFYKALHVDNCWGSGIKQIYDPCPSGWRVPDFQKADGTKNIFSEFSWSTLRMLTGIEWRNSNVSITESVFNIRNGMEYTTPRGDKVWFPFFRMREYGTGLLRDPYRSNATGETQAFAASLVPAFTMYSAAESSSIYGYYVEFKYAPPGSDYGTVDKAYGFSVRCVQN